jgi:ketosteroid isomerase-like protein
MKRINRRAAILGIATAAALAAPQSKEKGAAAKDRVADTERAFAASMAQRDKAAFESHVSPEAIFFGGDGTQVSRGRRAVVAAWSRFFEGPSAPFSWAPDLVEVLDSGTLALSTGPVKNPAGELIGRFTSIWRLENDGKWRVIFDRGCPVCKA